MSDKFLPFSRPSIDEATIDEVTACLKSGWLATGPRVKRFEEMLQKYLNAPQVLALTSATAGLQLALQALQFAPGEEVITTPMTFVATLNTIVQAGAKPVLVDLEPTTYNMDVNKIAAAITPRTRAILPVHFAGIPVDLDPLYALAEKHNLRVIEDAAHAIGSHYKGKLIGSFGDTQVFSFHPNKVMTTGEGGAVITRDEALAKKIITSRFHGIDREAWNRYGKGGSAHYDVIEPGFKYNMMDLQAAIGIHQLANLESFIAKRTALAKRYLKLLSSWPELILPQEPTFEHRNCWYIFAPLIDSDVAKVDRDTFMQKMQENNVGTGYHYQAVHLYTYYREKFGFKRGDFPNAEMVSDRIVSLPLFPDMTFEDQDRVIAVMEKILKQ